MSGARKHGIKEDTGTRKGIHVESHGGDRLPGGQSCDGGTRILAAVFAVDALEVVSAWPDVLD